MANINFTKKTVGYISSFNTFTPGNYLQTADFDNDGDRDIVATSVDERSLYWFENDGDGNTWTKYSIDGNFDYYRQGLFASDLDKDGNVDLISSQPYEVDLEHQTSWWSNVSGDGTNWLEYTFASISGNENAIKALFAEDLDLDGDVDVLGVDDASVYILDNPNGSPTDWNTTTAGDRGGNAVAAGAIDEDLYPDLVVGDDTGVYWLQNVDGDFSNSISLAIDPSNTTRTISSLYLEDINGDTYLDIVAADSSNNQVVWWQNNGDGSSWTERVIVEDYYALDVYAKDMDNDGDLDILSTAGNKFQTNDLQENDVTWWENTQTDNSEIQWIEHTIANSFTSADRILADDFDGDGDFDVVAASSQNGSINWWENDLHITEGDSVSYSFGDTVSFAIDSTTTASLNEDYELQDGDGNLLTPDSTGTYSSSSLTIQTIDDSIYDSGDEVIKINLEDNTIEHNVVDAAPTVSIGDYTTTLYETPKDFGNTVSLDGENDYVAVGGSLPNAYTKEAWINIEGGSNARNNIISSGDGTSVHAFWAPASQNFRLSSGHYGKWTAVQDSESLIEGVWYHVAVTYDGSDEMKLYKNGELMDTATGVAPFEDDTSTGSDDDITFNIGKHNNGNNFAGEIDEVRIWNGVRTREEIQENIYTSLTGNEDNLTTYYSFNEDATLGNVVSDRSTNGFTDSLVDTAINNYDGTLTNGDGNNFDDSFSFTGYVDLELDNEVTNEPGIIVDYQIDNNSTATQDEDYYSSQTDLSTTDSEPQTNSIFIPQGEDSGRIYLTALPDEAVEENETINISLAADTNNTFSVDENESTYGVDTEASAQITLQDSDRYTVDLIVANEFNEDLSEVGNYVEIDDDGNATFQVKLGSEPTADITVDVTNNSTTVTSLTFSPDNWDSYQTAILSEIGRDLDLTLTASGGEYANLSQTISVVEDDGAVKLKLTEGGAELNITPTVSINAVEETAVEGAATPGTFTVALDTPAPEGGLVIPISISSDATEGIDYEIYSDNSSFDGGNAIAFDGDGDYIEAGNVLSTAYTKEAWIKIEPGSSNNNNIISGQSDSDRHAFWAPASRNFQLSSGHNGQWTAVRDSESLTEGVWYHVAVTYDGSDEMKLYKNGELVDTATGVEPLKEGVAADIGKFAGGNYFDGEIDEVRIWNQVRSQEEIQSNLYTSLEGTETGLTSYYDFEKLGTNRIFRYDIPDETSNDNDGVPHFTGKALKLDGANDYVALGDILPNAYTKEAWVKINPGTGNNNNIISGQGGSDRHAMWAPANYNFELAGGHNGNWQAVRQTEGGLIEGEWHHVAVTYDGSSEMRLYVDGVYLDTATGIDPLGDDAATYIGKFGSGSYFDGEIDEVRIWNEARTPSQISNNRFTYLDGSEDGLIAYYNFDNDTGSTIDDLTQSDLDGTLINSDGDSFVESEIGYNLSEWEYVYDRFVEIPEGEISDSITISKVDDEVDQTNTESVTVTLEAGSDYLLNEDTQQQSASVELVDNDTAGIEVVKLQTVGSIDDSSLSSLVSLELRSFAEIDTGALASVAVSLAQEPTEDVTVTLSDSNGNDSGEIVFTSDNWNQSQSAPLTLIEEAGFGVDLTTSTDSQTDPNYGSLNFSLPISTETVATSLDYYDNTLITAEVLTVGLEVTSAYDATTGSVGLSIASGTNSYTLAAGEELSFRDGAIATVTQETTITTDEAGTAVPVTLSNSGDAIAIAETSELELSGEDSTTFAVRLNTQPTGDATVTLTIPDVAAGEGQFLDSDTQELKSTLTLSFNSENWDSYQPVTLYGIDDSAIDGNVSYSIDLDTDYDDVENSVLVINRDNDEETLDITESVNASEIIASVQVIDSEIAESSNTNADTLQIDLSEPAPTDDYRVRYTVSGGTATPDVDFVDLGGFVERTDEENPLSSSQTGLSLDAGGEVTDFKLADLDLDGDLDAVIIGDYNSDGIIYLENVGSSFFPYFVEQTASDNPFEALASDSNTNGIALGDLNNDTKPDALVNRGGTLYYLQNITSDTDTQVSFSSLVDTGVSISNAGVPTLIDLNSDGTLELFVGESDGTISHYEYAADSNASGFTFTENATTNPLANLDVGNDARPNFVDRDGDGDLDVVVGSRDNNIAYYENVGSSINAEFVERTGDDNPFSDVIDSGNIPVVADLNEDEDLDLFDASSGREIAFYENVFYQEVIIPKGSTTASVPLTTIPDDIAEYDETIEVDLSAKASQTFGLVVTEAYNNGTVGLQLDTTETAGVNLTSGSQLTFSNGAIFTVADSVNLVTGRSESVTGTLDSGTSIEINQTTDFVESGYRRSANLLADGGLTEDDNGQQYVSLSLDEASLDSLTLNEGTIVTFASGAIVTVTSETTIDSTASSVAVELSESSSDSSIITGDTASVNDLVLNNSNGSVVAESNIDRTITIIDDDDAGLTFAGDTDGTTAIETAEADAGSISKTFSVALDTEPTENVAVYFGNNDTSEGLLSDSDETEAELVKVVFSPDNWDTPQSIDITPADDRIQDGSIDYEVVTTVVSDDVFYNEDSVRLVPESDFEVTDDAESTAVDLIIDELNIAQTELSTGTQLTFDNGAGFTVVNDVVLSNSESTAVDLAIDADATEIDAGTTTTLDVTVLNDDEIETTETIEIVVINGYNPETGTMTVQVNSESSYVEIPEDATIAFDNGVAGTISDFSDSTSSVSFFQFGSVDKTIQEVNFDLQGFTVSTEEVTHFTESISPDISVTNADNDVAGVTVVASDTATLEGYSNNFFRVKLDSEPVGEVEVTMSPIDVSGDKDYNLQIADEFEGQSHTITFDATNWNVEQSIELTAVDDYDVEYNHTSYVDFAVSSEEDPIYDGVTPPEDVTVAIEDNDLPVASIQAIAGIAEGDAPGYFVITLDTPAPSGFDGTGMVVNYAIDTANGTVDIDQINDTDDLKPLGEYDKDRGIVTGSVRIAPGEDRSPLIAFPIDDFVAEGVNLKVVSTDLDDSGSGTLELIINDDTAEFTIPVGTELSFEGCTVFVVGGDRDIVLNSGTEDIPVTLTQGDSSSVVADSLTSIDGESLTVYLTSGDDYLISDRASVSAIVEDNDKPGIRVVGVEDPVTLKEDGGTSTEFYVSLLSQPNADVTIDLAAGTSSQNLVVDSIASGSSTEIYLKLEDAVEVSSLLLEAGTYDIGDATVEIQQDVLIGEDPTLVTLDDNSNVAVNDVLSYSYEQLEFLDGSGQLTFTSDNWYQLQTVIATAIDDNVVETGDYHTATIAYQVTSDDDDYSGFEVAPQTVNIIDRTFDTEATAESLIEGFLTLQDSIENVTLPIVGDLGEVSPSFLEDFLDNIVAEVRATEELTAESFTEAINNAFATTKDESDFTSDLVQPEFEITDLSNNNIEFKLGVMGEATESISIDGDLGLPALGIGIDTDGSFDLGMEYDVDLAFGINSDDGFYINTEDTSFGVGAGLALSEDFSATGNLGFLQLDITDGLDPDVDDEDGTAIDLEFLVTLQDALDEDDTQLTLSELNTLRQSDNVFDWIQYGFSGDAVLDLNLETSVEGDGAFPSFGFNIYSELPLFNYSNTEDAEELDEAQVVIESASGTLKTDSDSSINLSIPDRDPDADNTTIRLNKGTELSFYTDNGTTTESASVILQKAVTITEGGSAEAVTVRLTEDSKEDNLTSIAAGATSDLVGGDFNISFNDITLDFGSFVTDLISPIITYVNDLIEPFEPIVEVLQTEVELIDTLGLVGEFDENGDGQASLIEVASAIASAFSDTNLKYTQFFDAVTGIIDLLEAVKDLEETIDSGATLDIDFGSYTLQSFGAASDDESDSAAEYDTDSGTNGLNSDTKNAATNKSSGTLKTKISNVFSKLDELGISLPILEDPITAIDLFLGQDVDLVTYDVPELDIQFDIEQEFPILAFPSIDGLLEGSFSIYSDLLVGYDTYGLSQWSDADFALADSYQIFDGFYLSDIDPDTEEDIDELTMDATIAAGLSASAVVAKAEVTGGITGTAGLDIVDGGEYTGTSDGKLRGSEILDADSLFDLFSLSGSLEAFLKGAIKVGVDVGFFEIMKTVWEEEISTTIFEFELNSTGGTVSQYYVEGATVFFDSNLNGKLESGEPSTVSNIDGSYTLDVPLLFFDTNDNGEIDPEEGQIVSIGGIDTAIDLEVDVPLTAPYGSQMVTPLTTVKQHLIKNGMTAESAEAQIKTALNLPDVDLDTFDPIAAIALGDPRGATIYQAHNQVQNLFTQATKFVEGLESESNSEAALTDRVLTAISQGLVESGDTLDLGNESDLKQVFSSLEQQISQSNDIQLSKSEIFDAFTETVALSNQSITEAFADAPLDSVVGDTADIKQIVRGDLGILNSQLGAAELTIEEYETRSDSLLVGRGDRINNTEDDLLNNGAKVGILEGTSDLNTFVLKDAQTVRIHNFELEGDRIGLSDGMTYDSLNIEGKVNSIISYEGNSIATVLGVSPDELSRNSFVEL